MPFPLEAQRRGGSRPATDSQKQAARRWITLNQPWTKSTGPRTQSGRAIASRNAQKTLFKHVLKAEELGSEEYQIQATLIAKALEAVERRLSQLAKKHDFQFQCIIRQQELFTQPHPVKIFSLSAALHGCPTDLAEAVFSQLRSRFEDFS